MQGADVMLGDH